MGNRFVCGGKLTRTTKTKKEDKYTASQSSSSGTPKRFVAIFNYEGKTSRDLSFQRGDLLDVDNATDDGWWLARSVSTGREGYIPANYIARYQSLDAQAWYFSGTNRAASERYLMVEGNESGCFMVRESEANKGEYALSIRDETSVKHYRIRRDDKGMYFISRRTFQSLQELVGFYMREKGGLCVQLRSSCSKGAPTIDLLTPDQYEVDRSEIILVRKLGEGQFGAVYEGLYKNTVPVAIKRLLEGTMNPEEFLAEAQIMKKLKHPRLVKLLGVCSRQEPIWIITELMRNGSLLNYLRTAKGKALNISKMVDIGAQIAEGMRYLESQRCIHRDLAARNVLVGENNLVKIADFGLARLLRPQTTNEDGDDEIYMSRGDTRLPVRWTAPEAAIENKFSHKSDVWSFGIVLVEITTFGGLPYGEMKENKMVLVKVQSGYRLPPPYGCPEKLHTIMLSCWKAEPANRPTFETLQHLLEEFFSSGNEYRESPT